MCMECRAREALAKWRRQHAWIRVFVIISCVFTLGALVAGFKDLPTAPRGLVASVVVVAMLAFIVHFILLDLLDWGKREIDNGTIEVGIYLDERPVWVEKIERTKT